MLSIIQVACAVLALAVTRDAVSFRRTLECPSTLFSDAFDSIQGNSSLPSRCRPVAPRCSWAQVPLLLERIQAALHEGKSVVVGLTTTGEAYAEARHHRGRMTAARHARSPSMASSAACPLKALSSVEGS